MKKLLLIILAAVAVISVNFVVFAGEDKSAGKVIAYYFHGNFRCANCLKIEQYSKEAIEQNFKDELSSGKLVFKVINIETKGNEHFVQDYQLYTKSLVISLVRDGKEVKFDNLTKVWEFLWDRQKFHDYVKEEVTKYLKEL